MPQDRGIGWAGSALPEFYSAEVESYEGETEDDPIEHQWRTFQSTKAEWKIKGGTVESKVTELEPVIIKAIDKTIDRPTSAMDIWCKITVDAVSDEVLSAVIESGSRTTETESALPDNTDTEKYWLLAEVYNEYPSGSFYPAVRQIQFEPIRLFKSESILHPFKVTSAPDAKYDVAVGVAGGITIPESNIMPAEDDDIYVKITRDAYSRAVTAAVIDFGPLIPPSDQTNQYVLIARVTADGIKQFRFEDIRLTEFLISEAGELKLVSVFDTTNTYAPPPP